MASPNQSHRDFFRHAFGRQEYGVTKLAIYTRIQSLLNHRIFHDMIVGASTINLKALMEERKIIIFNLAQ